MIGRFGVQPVRSGWLVLLFDYGVVGVAAIVIAVYALVLSAARKSSAIATKNRLQYALQVMSIGGLVGAACMTAGVATWTSLALFAGFAWASSRIHVIEAPAVTRSPRTVKAICHGG
jgi:hypothetical protein